MPYIVVKVGGYVRDTGNGSLWVDGFPYSHVKQGYVIRVSEGYHSIKYVPTLKKTEWTTSVNFYSNTVMEANVIDEDFSSPSFTTHLASDDELSQLERMIDSQELQNIAKNKEQSKMNIWYALRCVLGIIAVIAGLYITFKFKQTGWEECIIPSLLIGVGAGLIKSYSLQGHGIDIEEVGKGFFIALGWFAVMVVINFIGKLFM